MTSPRDEVPAYRTIRMAVPETPVAELTDLETWQARSGYPKLLFGGPAFGVARERDHGGWELHRGLTNRAPQDARDAMGAHFRRLAREAGQSGDQARCGRHLIDCAR